MPPSGLVLPDVGKVDRLRRFLSECDLPAAVQRRADSAPCVVGSADLSPSAGWPVRR